MSHAIPDLQLLDIAETLDPPWMLLEDGLGAGTRMLAYDAAERLFLSIRTANRRSCAKSSSQRQPQASRPHSCKLIALPNARPSDEREGCPGGGARCPQRAFRSHASAQT